MTEFFFFCCLTLEFQAKNLTGFLVTFGVVNSGSNRQSEAEGLIIQTIKTDFYPGCKKRKEMRQ